MLVNFFAPNVLPFGMPVGLRLPGLSVYFQSCYVMLRYELCKLLYFWLLVVQLVVNLLYNVMHNKFKTDLSKWSVGLTNSRHDHIDTSTERKK